MKLFVTLMLWLVVFLVFPLAAILALILCPIVWLISLPLRLIGISVSAAFDLLGAILHLPARILGGR